MEIKWNNISILIIIVITNLYIISKNYLDIISNRLSQKKAQLYKKYIML